MGRSFDRRFLARLAPTAVRVAVVPVLLADEDEWQGHVASLSLELRPGSGRLVGEGPLGPAARQACEIAITAVLGSALSRWDAAWTLKLPTSLPTHVVDGDSLGLPVAVATRAARDGLVVPERTGFSGRVDPAGRIGPVGGVRLKAKAAADAGLLRWFVAPGCEPSEVPPREEVASLDELWPRLWPRADRPPWARVAALLLLPPLLALTGLSARPDHALELGLLRAVSAPLPAGETVIVALPALEQGPDGAWRSFRERRARVAALVEELVAARVRSVSFDLAWHRADPADDTLATALRRAAEARVPVVLALHWVEGQGPLLPASPALRALVTEGVVRVAHAQGESEQTRALDPGHVLVRDYAEGRWIWHAAVETVASWSPGLEPPRLDGDALVIGPLRAPSPLGRLSLRPVVRSTCWLWTEPGWTPAPSPGCEARQTLRDLDALRGAAVWVGVRGEEDAFSLLGVPVAGVDVQAAATEVLASSRAPRAAGLGLDALAAGLVGLLLALARLGARPGVVPALALALLPPLGLAGLAALSWLVAPIPVLLATAAGLAVGRVWRGGAG